MTLIIFWPGICPWYVFFLCFFFTFSNPYYSALPHISNCLSLFSVLGFRLWCTVLDWSPITVDYILSYDFPAVRTFTSVWGVWPNRPRSLHVPLFYYIFRILFLSFRYFTYFAHFSLSTYFLFVALLLRLRSLSSGVIGSWVWIGFDGFDDIRTMPDRRWGRGLKIPILPRRPLWMAP